MTPTCQSQAVPVFQATFPAPQITGPPPQWPSPAPTLPTLWLPPALATPSYTTWKLAVPSSPWNPGGAAVRGPWGGDQRSSMFSCGLGDPRLSEPQRASYRLSGYEWEGDQVPSASLMDTTVLAGLRGEGVSGTLPSAPWTV